MCYFKKIYTVFPEGIHFFFTFQFEQKPKCLFYLSIMTKGAVSFLHYEIKHLSQCLADVRDLIQVDDAMEDTSLNFGPNGGLVFCME